MTSVGVRWEVYKEVRTHDGGRGPVFRYGKLPAGHFLTWSARYSHLKKSAYLHATIRCCRRCPIHLETSKLHPAHIYHFGFLSFDIRRLTDSGFFFSFEKFSSQVAPNSRHYYKGWIIKLICSVNQNV